MRCKHFTRGAYLACTLSLSLLSSGPCYGEVFELVTGGKITGKLLNDAKEDVLKIRTNEGVEIEIARSKVASKPRQGSELEKIEKQYEKFVAKKEDTAEANREIASKCFDSSAKELHRAHLERVVELDPTDDASWTKLEYVQDKTHHWVRRDTYQMMLGLVKNGRGWTTPQARAIAEVDEKRKRLEVEMKKEIGKAIYNLDSNGKRGLEAQAFLKDLPNNPNAAYAVKELLNLIQEGASGNGDPFMGILERMPGNLATQAFIELANTHPNQTIVSRCIEALQRNEWARDAALDSFIGELYTSETGTKRIEKINRAGRNISALGGDKRAIVALISKLKTKLVTTRTIAPTNTASNGNVAMGTGGTVSSEQLIQHPPVLDALIQTTGNNYGYNDQAWREWYANEFSVMNTNLRRDE